MTCVGAAGVVITVILAVKATPKAVELIKENSRKNHDGDPYAYTKQEAIKSCWACYIPTAFTGIATIACIFGANIMSKKNQASLASAYALVSESYHQYRNAAKSVYGEDADEKIKVEAAKNTYVHTQGIFDSNLYSPDLDKESEELLFYDAFTQKYFNATMAAVINAEYNVNRNLMIRGFVPFNEFYEFLGLDKIDGGDDIGWDVDILFAEGWTWLDFDNQNVKIDGGMECCIISSMYEPTPIEY